MEKKNKVERKKDEIQQRMDELEILIKETAERLPAHSTKPPVMMELLAYEDEYEALQAELNTLKKK
jgi:hypothetical protein